jgi:hypothetical protein
MDDAERTFYAALNGVSRGRLRAGQAAGQQGRGARLRDDDLPEDRRVELRRRRRTLRRRSCPDLHEGILTTRAGHRPARRRLSRGQGADPGRVRSGRDSAGRHRGRRLLGDLKRRSSRNSTRRSWSCLRLRRGRRRGSAERRTAVMAVSAGPCPRSACASRTCSAWLPRAPRDEGPQTAATPRALWGRTRRRRWWSSRRISAASRCSARNRAHVPGQGVVVLRVATTEARRRRAESVQAGRRPARDDLHGGGTRGHQPAARAHPVQLRPAVEPDGHGAAHRAHPSLRAEAHGAGLQPRPVRHHRGPHLPAARREADRDREDARQGRRARATSPRTCAARFSASSPSASVRAPLSPRRSGTRTTPDEGGTGGDGSAGLGALEKFARSAADDDGSRFETLGGGLSRVLASDGAVVATFCADRDRAVADEKLALLGLDHPLIFGWMENARALKAEELGVSVSSDIAREGVLSLWQVVATNEKNHRVATVMPLAVDAEGRRFRLWRSRPAIFSFFRPLRRAYRGRWRRNCFRPLSSRCSIAI